MRLLCTLRRKMYSLSTPGFYLIALLEVVWSTDPVMEASSIFAKRAVVDDLPGKWSVPCIRSSWRIVVNMGYPSSCYESSPLTFVHTFVTSATSSRALNTPKAFSAASSPISSPASGLFAVPGRYNGVVGMYACSTATICMSLYSELDWSKDATSDKSVGAVMTCRHCNSPISYVLTLSWCCSGRRTSYTDSSVLSSS